MVLDPQHTCNCTSLLLASSVILEYRVEDYAFRRRLISHVDVLPGHAKLNPWVAGRIYRVYLEAGRYNEAEVLLKSEIGLRTQLFGKDSPGTLRSISNLATTYLNQGRWKEAEELNREVVEVMKRVLGSEHPDTLTSMHWLAVTCRELGQLHGAGTLMAIVVDTSNRVLGDSHPNTTRRFKWLVAVRSICQAESTRNRS
jgi:hypothetical protein